METFKLCQEGGRMRNGDPTEGGDLAWGNLRGLPGGGDF